MIKVAMLSYWHVHANDYNKQAIEHPDTKVVAVWDEVPERGRKKAEEQGVPFYESLDELLTQPHIDGVIVDSPTSMHRDIMVAAARAGKHIFTEKVVAPTLAEVQEILHEVDKAKVKLTVSLPRLNDSSTLAIQQFLTTKSLGQITFVRVRLAHNGSTANWLPAHFFDLEQCGGGALIDLGCHPMYLTRLFLGVPESVSATYGYVSHKAVEDNAVSILTYPNGAIGIAEASFVNSHSPFVIEIQGTEGCLLYSTVDNIISYRTNSGSNEVSSQWSTLEQPANHPSAFDQWVGHIQHNTIATENIALAVDLTRLMEASNLSAAAKTSIALDELKPFRN